MVPYTNLEGIPVPEAFVASHNVMILQRAMSKVA
jgi:hypothetical protein